MWLENQGRHLEKWRRAWEGRRFDYVQIRTDEPLDRAVHRVGSSP